MNGVAVVGCGPAGSAAAIALARAGRSVIAFEREAGPHPSVCGEFVSREACDELVMLGVDPFALGAAPIDRVRVTSGRASVLARLPFTAASLSRNALDEALIARAAASGADVRRGARVIAIDGPDGGPGEAIVRVRTSAGDAFAHSAARVILASGKTELAGFRRTAASANANALGFKTHVTLDASAYDALGTIVELNVFDGGYAGMQRIERGMVAFALVVEREVFARLGSWQALLAHVAASDGRIERRLACMRELWPKPLAVSGVPYGFVFADSARERSHLYRVGDQFAVIPSFTGDGMAIALLSGTSAAEAIVRGEEAARYHAAMRRRLARPMAVARAVSRAIASRPGRAAVVWPARVAPGLFTFVAALTRVPRARATPSGRRR